MLLQTGISLHINVKNWDKWNMNSKCPTNYSASNVEVGGSSNIKQKSEFLLNVTCACKNNGCHEVTAYVCGHQHHFTVGCVRAIQKSSKELTEQSTLAPRLH